MSFLRVLCCSTVLLAGCTLLESNPNQTWAPPTAQHLTAQNLQRLRAHPKSPTDTVRFVFVGDSQRFYDETEDFVRSVNQQPGIDFVLVGGDISDFGLTRELRWVHRRLSGLRAPYLTVIGNHDQVGNGRAAYQQVYGPLNYSFRYGGTKFVCVDTNGRESGFRGRVPDVPWLRRELADTAGVRRTVVVSHVPPTDSDFDPQLIPAYTAAIGSSPQVVLHLAAHIHRYTAEQPYHDGVPYLTTYHMGKRRYLVLSVWGAGQFNLQTVSYGPAA
ncbi:metallophosphoesterase [Hymenobacter busanensis]|uniref:Metallophosphoesterase n=1 Tax=Hymenobacter busanensis TaxID=2607656 RepID=A0A7L5A0Q3_9BACT|nr:metallophosphoesterase [Hymenobacter busanensis]KAA9333329.1 metallophosphoesterase [Hymenobacter busanensis]QHJ07992.1 metallophosphoesterase [Hymenobacter busanensis]